MRYLVLMAVLRRPQPKHVLPPCPDLSPSEGVELTTDIYAGWHGLAPGRWSLDLGRSGASRMSPTSGSHMASGLAHACVSCDRLCTCVCVCPTKAYVITTTALLSLSCLPMPRRM